MNEIMANINPIKNARTEKTKSSPRKILKISFNIIILYNI